MQEDKQLKTFIATMDLMKKSAPHFRSDSPLRGAQIAILSCIFDNTNDENTEMKPSQISVLMNLQQPTVSPTLKDLEQLELINRRNDNVDRRHVYYSLTKKGRMFMSKHRKDELIMFKGLSEYLGNDDTEKFIEILRKIIAYMVEKNGHGGNNTGGNIC